MARTHVEKFNKGVVLEDSNTPLDELDLSLAYSTGSVNKRRYAPISEDDQSFEEQSDYSPKNSSERVNDNRVSVNYRYGPSDNRTSVYVDNNTQVYQPQTNFYVSGAFTSYAIEYLRFLKSVLKETMKDE
jgi:hypothetical protein